MKRILRLALALCLLASCAGADALDPTAFSKKVSFTASGYDGTSTLENFPVLVRLSEGISGFSYDDIGTTTNAAYANLRFADASHANLDYEIETWDPAGTSFVWVSLPTLSGTGTRFGAYYVPAAGATLPAVHPTNVWTSAGYVGVWHLSDIVKNYANGYKNYDDHLWGHVFPDSTGRGAHATKGTTSWNTSLINVPNELSSDSQRFPESNGRANGTLGAQAYTPFTVPPTADGGGAGDWNFATTGYTTETWIYPKGGRSILASSQSVADSVVQNVTNFIHVSTAGARIAGNGWGGSTMPWVPGTTTETDSWHFVTTVWTPADSSDKSVLYGSTGDAAPRAMDSKDYHATDQFMTDGMGLTTSGGSNFGLDEMRVRRGLSTADWIQANWDTQRVGTDFLEVGAVHDPHVPVVSDITQTGATAILEHSLAGGEWTGGTVKALFVSFPSHDTNAVAVADAANPSATATGLAPDTDYDVRFVVERGDAVVFQSPVVSFTTAGRPVLAPAGYRHAVTFTASGYDGTETLEHFPVLVHLSEAAVPGFKYTGVDPADIRFTAADGSLLAHEVETWDPAGLSTIWVSLPTLSGTDTAFTMHWKPYNGMGVAAQPVHRVWHYAGYLGVWHVNDTVQGYGRLFEDSSGYGMITTNYYASNNTRPPLVVTNAVESANGSAWFRNRNSYWGDTQGDYLKHGVTPEQTADWNFSKTGYSVETWARPAWLNSGDHGGMFCTTLQEGGNWNALNALCVRNDRAGFECNYKTHYMNNAWSGDETNQWHYVAGVWAAAGSGDASICYEARADITAGTLRTLVSRTDVEACDFVGRHMGLLGGNPPPRASGYQSYQVDEMRVRRGRSSEAWIQANWDTQRVGTDFLSVGEIADRLLPTLLLIH